MPGVIVVRSVKAIERKDSSPQKTWFGMTCCHWKAQFGMTVLSAALACAMANLSDAAPIVIKFSHVVAPNTPKGKAAEKFKRLAEEDTQGRVKVEVYPNGELFKDKDEIEALQRGDVQMLAPGLSKFGAIGVKGFELFDLPYIFPSKEILYRVTDGAVGKRLLAKAEPKGLLGLAFWDNGFKQISSTKEILQVKDFRGQKLRISSSNDVLRATMKTLGAEPKIVAFNDQYAALQNGMVDGTENSISNFYTQKLYEVQKHLTLSNHSYAGNVVLVNKRFWEALPKDIRLILEQNIKEATEYQRMIAQNESDEALIRLVNKIEIHILPENVRREWINALLPVHKQYEDLVGKENLQEIYAIAAQVEKEEREHKEQIRKKKP